MILFYSDYCPHCRMLLDTIERHDTQKLIKIVSIEALKAKGQIVPPQIKVVPALILMPSKEILFGKGVFDYLLLPGKGKLLTSVGSGPKPGSNNLNNAVPQVSFNPEEPAAYSITGMGLSDAFSSIEDHEQPQGGLNDRSYAWTTIDTTQEDKASVFANNPYQEETRAKKMLPDIDTIKIQRDMELTQNDLNTTQLLPPSCTR